MTQPVSVDPSMAQASRAATQPVRSRRGQSRALALVGQFGTVFVLAVMLVGFSVAQPADFFTRSNFINILNQGALTAIIAGGLTLVLVVGEFDLSIGFHASLAGVLVVGLMTNQHLGALAAVALVLLAGAVIGFLNGLLVTKLGVNALIATLGLGTVLVGLNFAYSGGTPVALPRTSNFSDVSLNRVLGVPLPVYLMAVVLALLWVLLNLTDAGQGMQAVGGNVEAARLSGIRVERVKILAFVVGGLCAALVGVLLAARIGSGQITAGDSFLLDAFAAAFLGSAALRNGQFHILGTFIGVLTVASGFTGLAIIGAPTFYQFLFKGVLLILAVALSSTARRLAAA